MKPKELVEALVRAADSDAASNEPKRIPVLRQSYGATRWSIFRLVRQLATAERC
jgi:hypothetical protein